MINQVISLKSGHLKFIPVPILPLNDLIVIEALRSRSQDPPNVLSFRTGSGKSKESVGLGVGSHINPRLSNQLAKNITWSTRAMNPEKELNPNIDGVSGVAREFAARYPALMEIGTLLMISRACEQNPMLTKLMRSRYCAPSSFFNSVKNTALEMGAILSKPLTREKLREQAEIILENQVVMKRQKVPKLSLNTPTGIASGYAMLRLHVFSRLMRDLRTAEEFNKILIQETQFTFRAAPDFLYPSSHNTINTKIVSRYEHSVIAKSATLARRIGAFDPALFILAKESCRANGRNI